MNHKIIYESEELVLIDKNFGLSTEAIAKDLKKVKIIQRLDTNTTGLIAFAKSSEFARYFQENKNKIHKYYLCVVNGAFKHTYLDHCFYHKTIGNKALASKTKQKEYKECKQEIFRISRNDRFSLLLVNIHTGRKHQIRCAMKLLNHSIVGDQKYGNSKYFNRQALHSCYLSVEDKFTYTSLPPKDFLSLIRTQLGISSLNIDEIIDAFLVARSKSKS